MKLNPESQVAPTDNLIRDVVGQFDAEKVQHWQEVSEGIGNVVVGVETANREKLYLKFYNAQHSLDRVRAEVEFTRDVYRRGLPVPAYRSLANGEHVGVVQFGSNVHAVTLSEGIEGWHPQAYPNSLAVQLAAMHGKLHRLSRVSADVPTLDIATDYSYYPNTEADPIIGRIDDYAEKVHRNLRDIWSELPDGQVHLDITRSNVLSVEERVTGIVDFEDITNAPLLFCLAGTLWDMYEAGASQQQVDAYVAAYGAERPLEQAEQQHIDDMVLLRGRIALHGALLTSTQGSVKQNQLDILGEMIK